LWTDPRRHILYDDKLSLDPEILLNAFFFQGRMADFTFSEVIRVCIFLILATPLLSY
jgi:hypothetical protein